MKKVKRELLSKKDLEKLQKSPQCVNDDRFVNRVFTVVDNGGNIIPCISKQVKNSIH